MFSTRQQHLLDAFLTDPDQPKSIGDLPDFGMDRTTVFRDLKKMVNAGLLSVDGKSYRLNQDSAAYLQWDLSRAPHQRKKVRYNSLLLGNYQPNRSYLLNPDQLKRLDQAGSATASVNRASKNYEHVLSSLLIDLTHASSNLENVNISWLDTKTLLEFGERPPGLTETQMRVVLNHKDAIAFLNTHSKDLSLTRKDLMDIHSLLMKGLLADASAVGGLRKSIIKIDGCQYTPPDNPHQIEDIFNEFCQKVYEIQNPYEQAFFVMTFMPYIQPFQDGNKRTSRIAMNIPLIRHELAPFSFSDINKRDYMFGMLAFYERGRHDFLAKAFTDSYVVSAARYAELIEHVNAGGILSSITDGSSGGPV